MIDDAEARTWIKARPDVDHSKFEKLDRFSKLLIEENERQNLVARSSLDRLWLRHIADSAQLMDHVPRGTSPSWLDLGTGAGFPGIVVAVLAPTTAVTLVESRTRRIDWLHRAIDMMGLPNVVVIGKRLEAVSDQKYGVISARAFAPLADLLNLSARFSTAATTWLLPKGRSATKELDELTGWDHMFHVELSLTDPEAGILVGNLIGRKGAKP